MRRLKVLGAQAAVALPRRKLFTVGKAEVIDPYGEVIALLSHVDDDLSRYVLSTAPFTSWRCRRHPSCSRCRIARFVRATACSS